jgi:hypothetical protein
MPRNTVDQWVLEYLRSGVLGTRYGNRVFIYEVPAGTDLPYVLIGLVSGVRHPRTQVLRDAGTTRYQIDVFSPDRYQGREDIEEVIRSFLLHQVRADRLLIEEVEVSGPRALDGDACYRFSCDIRVSWIQEEG